MKAPVLPLIIACLFLCCISMAQTAEKPFPQAFGFTMNGDWGNIGNKVYKRLDFGPWVYVFTLPFATDNGYLCLKDTGIILFRRNDDSLFYYTISNAKLERRSHKEMIESFCTSGIKTIIFSKGAQGCFLNASTEIVYRLQGTKFVFARKNYKGDHHNYLKENDDEIDQQLVEEFVNKIPAIYNKQATIDDLEFTKQEYDACKRNILAYKARLEGQGNWGKGNKFEFYIIHKNPDFSKLVALVDSVQTIDQKTLNKAFSYAEVIVTGGQSAKIKLVNTKNEELEIRTFYTGLKAFYFPWEIDLNGSVTTSSAIEINKFLLEVFPDFLEYNDKVPMIQNIVKQLYSQQEISR